MQPPATDIRQGPPAALPARRRRTRWTWRARIFCPAVVAFVAGVAALPIVAADPPADLGDSGPFPTARADVRIPRPDGPAFDAVLVYPAESDGGSAMDRTAGPRPAVVFGHGFLQTPDRYDGTYAHLASWGYAVLAPASGDGLAPSHAAFAADLSAGIDWLIAVSADPASPWSGAVDPRALAASGHSMGGGASLLAAAADSRIRAVANFAAAETQPSAIQAMALITVPVALIAGSDDRITPPADHVEPMFAAGRGPRVRWLIDGGFHCGFQDTPFPIGCDSGRLTRPDQLRIARRLLLTFFELTLRGRDARWPEVWGASAAGPGVTVRQAAAPPVSVGGRALLPMAWR